MPFGAIEVAVKFKPQLTQKIMAQRKEKALEIIDANAGPKKLCVFSDSATKWSAVSCSPNTSVGSNYSEGS